MKRIDRFILSLGCTAFALCWGAMFLMSHYEKLVYSPALGEPLAVFVYLLTLVGFVAFGAWVGLVISER